MRKIQTLGIALLALFAFSAVMASMASAETTLLAEWLVAGVAVAASLTVETSGTLNLSTLILGINGVEIECAGSFAGTINSNGKGTITAILNTSKEEIGAALVGLSLNCTVKVSLNEECGLVGSKAELWGVNLPWTTNLELMEAGTFLNRIFAGTTEPTQPGYEVLCVENLKENLCRGNTSAEAKNLASDVEGIFSAAVGSEKAKCTTGEGDLTGTGLTIVGTGTEVLAVSSE